MNFRLKDPGSAITHFIGMVLSVVAGIPLIVSSVQTHDYIRIASLTIFVLSMIGLYEPAQPTTPFILLNM